MGEDSGDVRGEHYELKDHEWLVHWSAEMEVCLAWPNTPHSCHTAAAQCD